VIRKAKTNSGGTLNTKAAFAATVPLCVLFCPHASGDWGHVEPKPHALVEQLTAYENDIERVQQSVNHVKGQVRDLGDRVTDVDEKANSIIEKVQDLGTRVSECCSRANGPPLWIWWFVGGAAVVGIGTLSVLGWLAGIVRKLLPGAARPQPTDGDSEMSKLVQVSEPVKYLDLEPTTSLGASGNDVSFVAKQLPGGGDDYIIRIRSSNHKILLESQNKEPYTLAEAEGFLADIYNAVLAGKVRRVRKPPTDREEDEADAKDGEG